MRPDDQSLSRPLNEQRSCSTGLPTPTGLGRLTAQPNLYVAGPNHPKRQLAVRIWHDPDLGRPIAAPLERCAELLGIDLATVREAAANVEPYIRADGTRIWSLL
jgi:hypothetical protein